MLGGRVEDWMKNILYQLIKGQTHVGMPRGAKMSMDRNRLLFVQSGHYLWAYTTSGKKLLISYAKQSTEYYKGGTLNKESHSVLGNSIFTHLQVYVLKCSSWVQKQPTINIISPIITRIRSREKSSIVRRTTDIARMVQFQVSWLQQRCPNLQNSGQARGT
jgi:hypothetical protein